MGRPQKAGLDYFPFSVDLLKDPKLREPRDKYGYIVNDVYIAVLSLLYKESGYYIPYETKKDKNACLWWVQDCLQGKYVPGKNTIAEVIEELVACELFSDDHYPKYITSKRCQQTYYSATIERKSVVIDETIWMLDMEDMKGLSAKHSYYLEKTARANNEVNRPKNEVNQPNNAQTKQNKNDVIKKYNKYILPRTREEWTAVLDEKVCLENVVMSCEAAYGSREAFDLVLNELLNVLEAGQPVTVKGTTYEYKYIAALAGNMERHTLGEIVSGFYEADTRNMRWIRKQISSPRNYILSILIAKAGEMERA